MTAANWDGTWDMVRSGPEDAECTVLLLPGGWCTAVFYQELMAEPALAGIRLVAVTLPGNGGTRAPQDLGVENYARLTAELAARLGCTAVVGHSMGANVALEMAGSGVFSGPVVRCSRPRSPAGTRRWSSGYLTGSPRCSGGGPTGRCGP
jgi:pimeloyl-ACP methyl ester carboxylesterase